MAIRYSRRWWLACVVTSAFAPLLLARWHSAAANDQSTLKVARVDFRDETFLPWTGAQARNAYLAVMYDYLIHLDSRTRELRPSLARSWEVSPDKTQITLTLQGGVPWHGNEGIVTSEDVKFTLDQVARKNSKNTNASYYRGVIKSVLAPNETTVVINLTRSDTTFLSTLTSNGSIWIVPKNYVERVGEASYEHHPIGSGPYRFVEMASGEKIVYEALKNHWRVVPAFNRLIYRVVPEEATRLAMLRTGEVDIAPIGHESVTQVDGQGRLTVKALKGAYSSGFFFGGLLHPDDPRRVKGISGRVPWADPRVREAMTIAIDRKQLVDTIYAGQAQPLNTLFFTPGIIEASPIKYNPQRARELLAEAGYAGGFDFQVPTYPLSPGAELPVVSEAVAGYWEQIGLRPKLVPSDFAVWRGTFGKGRTEGAVFPMRHPDALEWEAPLTVFIGTEAMLPTTDDATLSDLLTQLAGKIDPSMRAEIYKKFSQRQQDITASIGIALVDNVFGMNSGVVGGWPAPQGGYEIYQEYITRPGKSLSFVLYEP